MKKIGWIGTGVMGNAMVQHLIQAGYEVSVYNRTKSKTDNLVELGEKYVDSVSELAQDSDIIFSIVGAPDSVRDIYFGEYGIIENAKPGTILVDMTTTEPTLSKEIYDTASEKGLESLDAPVSGGDVGAIHGTLSIMVGGERDVFDQVLPLFEHMGKSITYTGESGTGQHTKMANQIGIAGNTIALCEALVYAEKSGLDLEKTIQVVANGAAGSWGWQNLAPRIMLGELDTCFFVKHFVKDMKIALDECKKMDIKLPGLELVHTLYQELVNTGQDHLGTQALIQVIRKINNMESPLGR